MEPENPASAPPSTPCSCNQGRVMLGPSVWSPCIICDGTGDRSKNRIFRDGWNAALAAQPPEPALRKEIEVLRGLLAAQRTELTESQAALDRMAAYDQRQQLVISDYADALALSRAQGAESMRDAVLRWHEAQRVEYRDLSGTNAFAGAYMGAHERSIAAISTLNVDNVEQ